jgi:hypothetical protein
LAIIISKDGQNFVLSEALILFGASLGWLIEILVSPYTNEERDQFSTYVGAVATFASGYLAAKADDLIATSLSPDVIRNLSPENTFRIFSVITAAIVMLLYTHAVRSYEDQKRLKSKNVYRASWRMRR